MEYKNLQADDISLALFAHFDRRQQVTLCWRRQNGAWVIREDPFLDDWSAADRNALIGALRETLRGGGWVLGAFADQKLQGFAAVKAPLFGQNGEYMDLSELHVSANARSQGIGRALFERAKRWAGEHGAAKLYISAHSAVESQAFYRAMGCADAQEPDPQHVRMEPFDHQLECKV